KLTQQALNRDPFQNFERHLLTPKDPHDLDPEALFTGEFIRKFTIDHEKTMRESEVLKPFLKPGPLQWGLNKPTSLPGPSDYPDEFYLKLQEVAKNLGAKPEDILTVFEAESGLNAWSNIYEKSGPVGLFQMVRPDVNLGMSKFHDKKNRNLLARTIFQDMSPLDLVVKQLELFEEHTRKAGKGLGLSSATAL